MSGLVPRVPHADDLEVTGEDDQLPFLALRPEVERGQHPGAGAVQGVTDTDLIDGPPEDVEQTAPDVPPRFCAERPERLEGPDLGGSGVVSETGLFLVDGLIFDRSASGACSESLLDPYLEFFTDARKRKR